MQTSAYLAAQFSHGQELKDESEEVKALIPG